MDVKTLDPKIQELIQAAVNVKKFAHCPYSNFPVGASVLCPDGKIYTGCNVENASYGLCVCAERNAIMNAVAQGQKKFIASAVSANVKNEFKGPCGMCRQVFAEFSLDVDLYLVKPDMTYQKVFIRDMLPMAFTPETLELERV